MVNEKDKATKHVTSALDKFTLDFEYNMTWSEAKKLVRVRTLK